MRISCIVKNQVCSKCPVPIRIRHILLSSIMEVLLALDVILIYFQVRMVSVDTCVEDGDFDGVWWSLINIVADKLLVDIFILRSPRPIPFSPVIGVS
jgi:hypothetical protein